MSVPGVEGRKDYFDGVDHSRLQLRVLIQKRWLGSSPKNLDVCGSHWEWEMNSTHFEVISFLL